MGSLRRAREDDLTRIAALLDQVLMVHHNIRPDLFKANCRKYNDREILALIGNDLRPIFVYEDENGVVQGYAMCVLEQHPGNNILTDIKTLYIDDLCVDESQRGTGIGKILYDYARKYAVEQGCHNVTLNVWEGNDSAIEFYKKLGFKPYKYGMETIL
ncbi:MAG: GNAT family N-acetyltransferase [Clostridiales bacterium]|nr:GNAT family N-acetyltransferase [Clostridiales bacterium]